MKKGNTESHAEARSSRRESNPPPSASPREKKFGWETKTFGEVLEIRNGRNQREVESADGEFPIYGSAGNVMGMATNYICEAGTTIIGRKGNINSPIYADTRFWNVDTAFGLAAKAGMDSRFLYFFCLSYDFSAHNRGTTIPSLVKSELLNISIPVPSLAEQQRIVGLLDEAFEGIATAKANAEKNLQNARALFESHLQSVFTQRGPGWVETTFEELIESNIIGLTKNSREQAEDKAWPYVKMNNITRDNRFDFSRFTCVDATAEEVSKFSLKDGDFLFNTRNSHELVGKSCIYESDSNDAVLYNNNIMRVRFQRGIDARFVLLAFSSKGVADELNALKSGTTNVSAIYFKDLKSLVIPVPPIAEQKKIAAKLDALAEETQRLTRLYERKHAALEALKKSLLHQAFTGEL